MLAPTPPPPPNVRYTLDQYAQLKAALASGARSVRYGDQQIDFQNPQQMRDTLALMELELGLSSTSRRSTPAYSKGLLSNVAADFRFRPDF